MKSIAVVAAIVIAAITFNSAATAPAQPKAPVIQQSVAAVQPPFRCAVFIDATLSREHARIEATLDDFRPLFERVRTTGGEIAFGLIREDSNRPLARCYIPEPPEAPAVPQPARGGNVFVNTNAKKREDAERKKYDAKVRTWQADADRTVKQCAARILPLIEAPATARATDITSALARADLMLAEPSPFNRPADAVIVLVSDALHNASTAQITSLRSNARVVVVNGIGSLGQLQKLSPAPVPFESTAAAIRHITR